VQKNYRELEIIIQECILNAVRESIPVETILRVYMDETVEEEVVEEIKEQVIETPKTKAATETQIVKEEDDDAEKQKENKKQFKAVPQLESEPLGPIIETVTAESLEFPELPSENTRLTFDNVDYAVDTDNKEEQIEAPKDIERLEEISQIRNAQRKLEEQMDEDDDGDDSNVRLKIMDDNVSLDNLDIHVIDPPSLQLSTDLLLDEIEVLP
jgi:hypothetical protein